MSYGPNRFAKHESTNRREAGVGLAKTALLGHGEPMSSKGSLSGFSPQLRVVLGPTNTGKTHLAMERLLAHQSGMIGLPLRLLAREVYDRCLKGDFGRVHKADIALITGEEKILPPKARYFICTTEAMPISREVEFVAIDECQLAADEERGHVFTDRILHARGTSETILLGAATMAPILRQLLGTKDIETRARFSRLGWDGAHKLSRLPRRSAIAAFSADNVYAIAEIIRQQRGGAAVVMGGLSPRTRNAQVEMYQSGEVDFLVATDAIGMGLNMDVDHVAFAQTRKFDGRRHRELSPAELAQIAGRAGRHHADGSFGVTADVPQFEDALIEQIETHDFDPVKGLYWRNPNLDFSSLEALLLSLEKPAPRPGLVRATVADDVQATKLLSRDPATLDRLSDEARVRLLWQVAQIPDFRKTTMGEHAALVGEIFAFLSDGEGFIPENWLADQIERCDRVEGDLDTLSTRLAHIRTWTYIAQRNDWMADPALWQAESRKVEERLSDALHMKLMGQFVDRKTSALMRRLVGKEEIVAEIEANGDILIAGEYMGRLNGLHVERDPRLKGAPGGTARAAVEKAVGEALRQRAQAVCVAADSAFTFTEQGEILWDNAIIGQIQIANGQGGPDSDRLAYLAPEAVLAADETLTGEIRTQAQTRLTDWLRLQISQQLEPLKNLQNAELTGLARGLAFQLLEHKGCLPRRDIADLLSKLDQDLRGTLRKCGVRFGFYHIFMPTLLKPAPARLLALLSLVEENTRRVQRDEKPRPIGESLAQLPAAGLTSAPTGKLPGWLYRATGFYTSRARIIRFDMLERLADIIRPLLAESKEGFEANEAMMSIMGCSGEELAEILTALGYRSHEVEAQKPQDIKPEDIKEQSKHDIPVETQTDNPTDNQTDKQTEQTEPPAPEATEAKTEEPIKTPKTEETVEATMRLLWRPVPRGHNARTKGNARAKGNANAKNKHRAPNDKAAQARPQNNRPHRSANGQRGGKRAEKQPDPSSPFAVLKQLQNNQNKATKKRDEA
ncbi:MAG: disulfide oxidoreductase [Alphaproteobacteria bacterium]|nr:disulfide oxidoreductase [Alphaproteobacteria bacterium]